MLIAKINQMASLPESCSECDYEGFMSHEDMELGQRRVCMFMDISVEIAKEDSEKKRHVDCPLMEIEDSKIENKDGVK